MGSASIQAKIKAGLAKAVNKTGSASSEKVYLASSTTTAGTPLSPGTTTTTSTELVNAIFKNYAKGLVDVSIKAGDRQLVSDGSVEVNTGDIINQGTARYIVVSVSVSAPTSDVLNYISQVRVQ